MAELRELLYTASPPAFDETDLDDLVRRVTLRRRTRRTVIVAVVVVVLPLLGVAFDFLRPLLAPPDEPRRIEFLDRPPELRELRERSDRADRAVLPPSEVPRQYWVNADPDEWVAFDSRNFSTTDAPFMTVREPGLRAVSERDVLVEGSYKGDHQIWQLGLRIFEDVDGTPLVCFELSVATCSTGGRRWNSEPLARMFSTSSEHPDMLPRWCVYGFVSEAVDRVRVDIGSSQTVDLQPHSTSLPFHASIYGHCQDGHPSEGTILTVTALDARGDVIQQRDQRL